VAVELSDVAQRVAWLLKEIWHGSQTQMAREISMRQSAISNVITGRQEPGRQLLTAMGMHPAINAGWLLTGQGTHFPEGCNLPVATTLFRGLPHEHVDCLGGSLNVPVEEYRPSRYWIEVTSENPWVGHRTLHIAIGDRVLLEPDRIGWPEDLTGFPCLVWTSRQRFQFSVIENTTGEEVRVELPEEISPEEVAQGKRHRVITFPGDPPAPPSEHSSNWQPRTALVAVGLARYGRFGSSGPECRGQNRSMSGTSYPTDPTSGTLGVLRK